MLQTISKLQRGLAVFASVAVLTGASFGVVQAQNSASQRHNSQPPVWEQVSRTVKINPNNPAPQEVIDQLVSLNVAYKGFDGRQHQDIIEVNKAFKDDTITFFKYAYYLNFPIREVGVSSDSRFKWDDNKLMAADITSGFNYRAIAGSTAPSSHGAGRAIDVNPRENPYITLDDNGNPNVAPAGAQWLSGAPGTLSGDHPLVQLMESRGWAWGGRWTLQDTDGAVIDYQHFQKKLPATTSTAAPDATMQKTLKD